MDSTDTNITPLEDGQDSWDDYIDFYKVMESSDCGQPGCENPYDCKLKIDAGIGQFYQDTRDGIALFATDCVTQNFNRVNGEFSIVDIVEDGIEIASEWTRAANDMIHLENSHRPDFQHIKYFPEISARSVGLLLMKTGDFRARLNAKSKRSGILMRQRSGYDIGTWKQQDGRDETDALIRHLNLEANDKYCKEVRAFLETELETAGENQDSSHALLQDGIYDFKTQEFTSYLNPRYIEKYGDIVQQSKLYGVCWSDEPSDILERKCTIYNPKDGTSWSPIRGLKELVGDGIALKAVREIMHFAIRRTRGGFAWFFINTTGNAAGGGGKSTVIQIIKNMCGGERNCISLSYEELGKRFAIHNIESAYAILSDETSATSRRPESTDVYKNIATNGSVCVEAKYKDPYYVKFDGCMVQACNGYPMFSDATDSMFRRFLALPFEKQMTRNGKKRDYIRDDYINRPQVIQCYVKWAMELGCLDTYSDDVIDYCMPYVEDIKNNTKTVFEFMPEMMRLEKDENYFDGMNEMGRTFLYALFCKWDEQVNSTRVHLSMKKFWLSVCEWVQSNPGCGWAITDKVTHMSGCLPYQKELVDFDLGKNWCRYCVDTDGMYRPTGYFSFKQKSIRCGLKRVNKLSAASNGTADADG